MQGVMQARGRWEMHAKFWPEKDKYNGLCWRLSCRTENSIKCALRDGLGSRGPGCGPVEGSCNQTRLSKRQEHS